MNQMYLLLMLLYASAVTSFANPPSFIEHERGSDEGEHFFRKRAIEDSQMIPIRIGFVQSNLDHGHDRLMDISDPFSANFGQHYTAKEVADLFAPPVERIDAVIKWIESNVGIDPGDMRLSPNKQWLHFVASAADLGSLLDTTYHQYEHLETGMMTIGCDSYKLPHHMVDHIDYIVPGVQHIPKPGSLPSVREKKALSAVSRRKRSRVVPQPMHAAMVQEREPSSEAVNCAKGITPQCIRLLYNITDTVKNVSGNSIGVFEAGNFLLQSDMNSFYKKYAPQIPQGTFPIQRQIDGAPTQEDGVKALGVGPETTLDFQIVYPLVYPTEVQVFQVNDLYYENIGLYGKNKTYGLFNTFFDAIDGSYCNFSAFGIKGDSPEYDQVYPDNHGTGPDYYKGQVQCGVFTPPPVLSLSYGSTEANYSVNYQRRQCQEVMKLGLQGVTVLAASGDSGVSPGFHGCIGPDHNTFSVTTIANCPYVTGVGGTAFTKGTAGQDPETAASLSGGGFSNIYPAPAYQNKSLATYFKKHPPPYPYYKTKYQNNITLSGRYNRAGRGVPDVSANAEDVVFFYNGHVGGAGGTSEAAPIWAGIITRINAARLSAGKKPIGFLNPTLYAHPEVFNDITSGNNPGCGTKGFTSVRGWDPVTGLGTPNYPKLKDQLVGLP